MAALPLSQTVEASARKRLWRSSALSLMTSTLIQGSVIGALVVVPLVAMQTPPLPHNVQSFQSFVPVVPLPPPPPRKVTATRRPRPAIDPSKILDDVWRAPAEPFDGILDEIVSESADDFPGEVEGVPGGLPGAPPAQPIVAEKPQEQAPSGPIEIGNLRPPRKIHHVNPVYPRVAILSKVKGVVEIKAVIDEEGNVVNLEVVRSPNPLLNQAALNAVKQWRYEPTYLNGTPVPIVMTVSVAFVLTP